MNTYQGGETSQGKIIPIKRHFSCLIFGIISPLAGSSPPGKYSYEISKPKLVYIWNNIYHTNTYSQHTKICIKLQVQQKVSKIIIFHRFIIKISESLYICLSSCLGNFVKGQTTTECIWCQCWTERMRFKCFVMNTCLV